MREKTVQFFQKKIYKERDRERRQRERIFKEHRSSDPDSSKMNRILKDC